METPQQQIERCDREIAVFRRHLMSGELTPWVDPAQPNAAVIDTEGLLCGISDWQLEKRILEAAR